MNGVITMSLKNEVYYHWSEVMFKSILRYVDVDFALVYDDLNLFKKYNLDKIVKYPIYLPNVENPYMFKYELINVSPFDNTIFFDADTIILKDITPLFDEQFLSVCGEWNDGWLYNEYSPFTPNPLKITQEYKLKKLYSTYSGFIRFEKTDFYVNLFKEILNKTHYNKSINKLYGRGFMPDEYFLNLSISDLNLKRFVPIKLYHSNLNDNMGQYYGYSFQGNEDIKVNGLETILTEMVNDINIGYYTLGGSKTHPDKELRNNKITLKVKNKLI
jgi:hypothetical protein